ncbi:MAG: siderophore-interacting protein [Actinomycetaceae bacterium]|nr:siderophore-interacting protein [Actinomycetaceae bacterium]MDO4260331.1 siderophore-interacting protein [Actinomycetaceae bacterium]
MSAPTDEIPPFDAFPVVVRQIRDLTPHMRRFTFAGEALVGWGDPGWDQRIKLILPAQIGGYSDLPRGKDWYAQLCALPPERRCLLRTYTTRFVRDEGGERLVDVDMVVHDPIGPASRWIHDSTVGTEAVLIGPRADFLGTPGGVDFIPPYRTDAFLIGGDETAAPAIARILEDLPPDARGIAVVEMPSFEDAAYLPDHPGFEVRIQVRGRNPHGEGLIRGVREAAAELHPVGMACEIEEIDVDRELLWEVPRHAKGGAVLARTSLYAWLAGEASAVRAMRRHLVAERGLDRRSVAFMGYWRQGKAEGA